MIAAKLIGIEWFKARHRAIFWIMTGFMALMMALALGVQQYQHAQDPTRVRAFTLPARWGEVIGAADIAMILVVTVLSLLIASERTWRTDRQNVIDGLSRRQLFGAKLMLSLLVAAIFWLLPFVAAFVFVWFDGTPGFLDGTGPLFGGHTVPMIFGFLLRVTAMAMYALMLALFASSSGAALALAYVFMVVQLPLVAWLARQGDAALDVARRAPFNVFDQLTNPIVYDAAKLERFNATASSNPFFIPLLPAAQAAIWSAGYALLFIGLGWLALRHRDL